MIRVVEERRAEEARKAEERKIADEKLKIAWEKEQEERRRLEARLEEEHKRGLHREFVKGCYHCRCRYRDEVRAQEANVRSYRHRG
jgi:hypothetical protein